MYQADSTIPLHNTKSSVASPHIFAIDAWEQPKLFVDEVRVAFKSLR
jgi:hypothetical protein